MQLIDRYAYTNRIRRVDPAAKAALAVAVLLLCLVLDRPAVGLLAAAWMWGLATWLAGLPAPVFGRILLAEGAFLFLSTVGIALSVSASEAQAPAAAYAWHAGPLWLSTSPDSMLLALRVAARALGAASAMNFLALTTPLVDLIDLLRRLHVPALLIDLMTVMYRFIFATLDAAHRIYVAQDSRLGYATASRSLASAGLLGSRLFVNTLQRSRRLQFALDARGYSGDLCVLPTTYCRDPYLLPVGAIAVATLLAVWAAL